MIRPLDTYVDHERMLDRYGLAYVCQHPEILFSTAYGPRDHRFVGNAGPDFGLQRNSFHATSGCDRAAHIGDLVLRAVEAYRILAELYAPCRPGHPDSGRL